MKHEPETCIGFRLDSLRFVGEQVSPATPYGNLLSLDWNVCYLLSPDFRYSPLGDLPSRFQQALENDNQLRRCISAELGRMIFEYQDIGFRILEQSHRLLEDPRPASFSENVRIFNEAFVSANDGSPITHDGLGAILSGLTVNALGSCYSYALDLSEGGSKSKIRTHLAQSHVYRPRFPDAVWDPQNGAVMVAQNWISHAGKPVSVSDINRLLSKNNTSESGEEALPNIPMGGSAAKHGQRGHLRIVK
ncbi:MAG: hypothetical protein ACOYK8_08295 [Alphaproteobacteria bacterium]